MRTGNVRQVFEFLSKHSKGFDNLLKDVSLVSSGNGRCVCKFKVLEQHANGGGTLHGGVTATLVDSVSTLALMSTEPHVPGVSTDLSVSYLRAAAIGEEVTIDAKTLKVGKTLSFLTVDLTDSKGRLIAQGKHTKFVGGN